MTYNEFSLDHGQVVLEFRPQVPWIEDHAHDSFIASPLAKLEGHEEVTGLARSVCGLLVNVFDVAPLIEIQTAFAGVEING